MNDVFVNPINVEYKHKNYDPADTIKEVKEYAHRTNQSKEWLQSAFNIVRNLQTEFSKNKQIFAGSISPEKAHNILLHEQIQTGDGLIYLSNKIGCIDIKLYDNDRIQEYTIEVIERGHIKVKVMQRSDHKELKEIIFENFTDFLQTIKKQFTHTVWIEEDGTLTRSSIEYCIMDTFVFF